MTPAGLDPESRLLRSSLAAPPRTLVDVLRQSVDELPDALALDNGVEVLTYAELADAADAVADTLRAAGVGLGDRVGVRIPSGTTDLYVAILGTLHAGAAYVPVDADDPDERARLVFTEAEVDAVVGADLVVEPRRPGAEPLEAEAPSPDDDAWIIFTSGSTGRPKGVAVTHRSAAAFVDAEARLFLTDAPLGPSDRVMAGLSVAFDASCEEMWLAWRYGACLVPAPRSLVRSGMDLGPWLVANDVTVVSTVPTLVALWPPEALRAVRLLILGGEACPPELGARLTTPEREVWNTYGPTEATVVACGARLTGEPPVRIGLPLDGWDLAVVDALGGPVPPGTTGELVIGGVGLARYLDPEKDVEKYAPMPTLGWERAYRSGDLVRDDGVGLVFAGRADDQVKLGGRRIELGEVDSALLALPGVTGAATAVRRTGSGNSLLVGYVATDETFDPPAAIAHLRATMPAALVPRLARVEDLPTRTSGKIDRDALPWPLPTVDAGAPVALEGTAGWVQQLWEDVLGAVVTSAKDDFFDAGGGSLTAAQLVSRLRARFPEVTVADVYSAPTVGALAALLDAMSAPTTQTNARVGRVPRATQASQVASALPLRAISGLRWLTWVSAGCNVASALGVTWAPTVSWWWVALGWALLVAAPGRMLLTVLCARAVLRGVRPGANPRGGRVHLQVWLAERIADELGGATLAGAPWMRYYARALGARVGRHVDLHSVPPVTGLLRLDDGCSVEMEVDLTGHWVDGDTLHLGGIHVGEDARVGARSTLLPGADVGARAEVAPGSAVFGTVPAGESWSGAPAHRVGHARGPWTDRRPENRPAWFAAYALSAVGVSLLPLLAVAAGVASGLPLLRYAGGPGEALLRALAWLPVGSLVGLVGLVVLAALVAGLTRLLGRGLRGGHHPIHGRVAWQAWTTVRLLDDARTWLFPLYSSSLTPGWLRLLGARVGPGVEASTVLLVPGLTSVGEGAFLADDTLLGNYELGGGWLRVDEVKIGKHAFVGNSGMTAPGRKVPRQGLVAVLSAAPRRTKAKRGTSWLGSPPRPLRRERAEVDTTRTTRPGRRLRAGRALVEACRVVAVWAHVALVVLVVAGIVTAVRAHPLLAAVLSGPLLLAAGAVAAAVTSLAKWALVGRLRPGEHPLWSSFVWRNELADTFVEVLAAPWFARAATGTPVLNLWLRSMGARIGRGVWCATYWLPEGDLVTLRDGATVNHGCVVQTHLFHDRVLSMDTVTLKEGATLGPNGVVLPAAVIGRHATVGPVSLVMRGEAVPDKTRWIGNPIGPWLDEDDAAAAAVPAPARVPAEAAVPAPAASGGRG
ncbi:MAG TPA: Pls/PosA family non-ribosomal peptide synthetase [Dermatophilaceae bacterium]|nr:Pls/PosA family non-ribosomal peptide synthetase [Dermatophilaceae bacterium]